MNLKDRIAKATKARAMYDAERHNIGLLREQLWARREVEAYLWNRREAIAELIDAAEAVGAHPFIYFGTDTLPGPDSGQHKIAALRKALESLK